MSESPKNYWRDLLRQLHLDSSSKTEVLKELQTHVQDKIRDLMEKGLSPEQAFRLALESLGKPRAIALKIYEIHSSSSWKDTLIGVLPHLMFSLLFAFHLWTNVTLVVLLLLGTALVSLRGWRNGRPSWTYPWLGYSLLAPVVSWVLALAALGYGAWSLVTSGKLPYGLPIYLASLIYIPVSLWIVISILRNVIKQDWLLASLTTFPFPFLAYWLLYMNSHAALFNHSFRQADTSTALVFLLLAISTAIFLHVGKRLLRIALLILTTPPIVVMAWMSHQGGPGYPVIFLYSVVSVALLLAPALIEQRLDAEEGEWKTLIEERS